MKPAQQWLALALCLTGCQAVTGLNDLQADRIGIVADGGSSGSRLKSGMRAGATGAAGTTSANPRAEMARMAAAGSGGDSAPARSGSSSTPQSQADDDAGVDECSTRITYGSAWIRPATHTDSWDDVSGVVTWDGSCEVDNSGNSFAQLSNGWRPFFTGRNSCVIAIDVRGGCAQTHVCSTRVSYGADWFRPDAHADAFDDVVGVVTTSGECVVDGEASYVTLSNGWQPHFQGKNNCVTSFRYTQCGGLFANPVLETNCPDPGVIVDGDQYVMTCTSAKPDSPLHVSTDLVHWKPSGSIFTVATMPEWADSDSELWAPELQHVAGRYLVYFTARHKDGDLAIGVATASSVLGPYRDSGAPLLRNDKGVIEPHAFAAPDGTNYLVWTVGSESAAATEIKLQPLASDGLALAGSPSTLLTSSEAWENGEIHAPWLSYVDGYYYLFYTAAAGESAVIAVARATSLTGPYTKSARPSVTSAGAWVGPTTGSLVRSHAGNWALLFHAWPKASVGSATALQQVLLAPVLWQEAWPSMLGAPSPLSQPMP